MQIVRANGGEPNSGRRLLSYALEAGIPKGQITTSASTWCYSTAEEVVWWSSTWADRVLLSTFASTALERGFATQENLTRCLALGNSGVRSQMHGFRFCMVRSFAARAEVVLGLVIRVLKKVCFEYVIDATCLLPSCTPQSRSKHELGLQYHRASSLISELEARSPHKCS
jgi:hypothetical protein